ncbi:MAG: efflux RND transporter periplasmic adaptor subunit [Selenomonadaceae bacterium]|nr:efflux RND transporter periplasmic adaptor subunit [Selenomonadaceae bacterium]
MVKTVTASQAGKIMSDVYPAVVKGRYESNLAFQTGGRIISRDVEKGSFVSAGQVLMTIDARDAVQQLNAGESQVELCRSQLNLAKSNLERYAALYKENAVAAATLDQYQAAYDNAVAAYNAAVAQAEQARNVLNYTELTANADGVISTVNAEAGQVVSAGQTVLTLVQADELEVEIDVPENHLKNISIGKTADVTFWAVQGRTQGVVREIAPMADSAARTYRVRLSLINPPPNIQLGMTAEVILNSADEITDAVILPLSAIYQTGNAAQVWIVTNENKVTLKNVTVENFSGNEVLVRGISTRDKVVAAGVHKLREGELVRSEE